MIWVLKDGWDLGIEDKRKGITDKRTTMGKCIERRRSRFQFTEVWDYEREGTSEHM